MIFLTVNTKLKKPERNIIFLGNITEACQLSNILATTVLNNFPCKPVILETYLTQQNWSLFKDRRKKFKVKKISSVCNYKKTIALWECLK